MHRKLLLVAFALVFLVGKLGAVAPPVTQAHAKAPESAVEASRPVRMRPLNRTRFPAERAKVLASARYPSLRGNFEVMRPASPRYNCIAWSAGITNRWIWPGYTLADFDRFYARHGYRRLDELDFRKQRGLHKVVLYGHVRMRQGGRKSIRCTHAARQLADGSWSSKLGKLPVIRHRTPGAIAGTGYRQYGQPVAVYVRAARSMSKQVADQ
jgi:hypothetical protein